MSVARLLFSGLLVASGLILGAFTLHNRFAPQWAPQTQAASPGESEWEVRALFAGDAAGAGKGAARPVRAGVQSVGGASPGDRAAAEAKAMQRLAEKKKAEQRKIAEAKEQQSQQAEPQSLWDWLNGN